MRLPALWGTCAVVVFLAVPAVAQRSHAPAPPALRLLVMDPLAAQNACPCAPGYAQRDYRALGRWLEERLGRPVLVAFRGAPGPADILVGKQSVIDAYAASHRGSLVRIAMLTDRGGSTAQQGLFVVRSDDPARTLADLRDHTVVFGPKDEEEKHGAALAAMRKAGLEVPAEPDVRATCNIAALAVVEREADAAAISGYALPLLSGCGTIKRGALKVVGRTPPVPFVAAYLSTALDARLRARLVRALLDVRRDPVLCRRLETRDGFVAPGPAAPPGPTRRVPARRISLGARHAVPLALGRAAPGTSATPVEAGAAQPGWTDWRGGSRRDGLVTFLPAHLPSQPRIVWRRPLASQSLGGVSATDLYAIVSDKSADLRRDVWRCLDARDGRQLWEYAYDAAGKMDYTNAPRATAVIAGGRVFLLGAFGHLAAVDLATGRERWSCDLCRRFGGKAPTWGFAGTPLLVDGKVVVATPSPAAALVALEAATGRVAWATPGNPPGYGSLLVAVLGGKRQIVGHDQVSLGGWDVATGRRLWVLRPPVPRDFNVPTPVPVSGRLLVATENNGARLYAFAAGGRIVPRPAAVNAEMRPTTPTPVAVDGMVWGGCDAGLFCLDLGAGLRTVWHADAAPFADHVSLIGGAGRVLVCAKDGRLALLPARPAADAVPEMVTVLRPAEPDGDLAVWSHPALVGSRLYLRSNTEVVCVDLG